MYLYFNTTYQLFFEYVIFFYNLCFNTAYQFFLSMSYFVSNLNLENINE